MPITNTQANDVLYQKLAKIAEHEFYEQGRLMNLVVDQPLPSGITASVPVWPNADRPTKLTGTNALTLDDNNDVSAVDITLEEYAVGDYIKDFVVEGSVTPAAMDLIKQLAGSLSREMDRSVTGVFDSFTTEAGFDNQVITAGSESNATFDRIMVAAARLRANSVPMDGDVYAVLHPYQALSVKASLSRNGTADFSQSDRFATGAIGDYYLGMAHGVQFFESPEIQINSATTGNRAFEAVGAVFHRRLIGKVMRRSLLVDVDRDVERVANKVVLSSTWGVAIVDPKKGVKLSTLARPQV